LEVRRSEILVAGAGPAGSSLARALACKGRNVLLVHRPQRCIERLELIAPVALGVVAALALDPLLKDPSIARPCLGIRRRWGRDDLEYDDFFCHPSGPGIVVNRKRFDAQLRHLAQNAGAKLIFGQVIAAELENKCIKTLIAKQGERIVIKADIAIDATGRQSALSGRLGGKRLTSDRLIAELEARFLDPFTTDEPGWLCVEGNKAAWSYQIQGPQGWIEHWRVHALRDRPRSAGMLRVDASAARLSPCAGSSWIAIGDAAASFDPVASQGLFNALSTALVAAGAILSPNGFCEEDAFLYSEVVEMTFVLSETERRGVYQQLGI
jgi:flavin-dependent dehydrogenase